MADYCRLPVGFVSTTFQNGEEGLANQTTGGAATFFTRDASGTVISERVGGASYYYLYDSLGNVIGLVNATGTKVNSYTYGPYGTPTASETVANPMRCQSDYYDNATGMYHDGARDLDPALGRFTQPDPSGQNPGYAYAGDDPVNDADPSGYVLEELFDAAEDIAEVKSAYDILSAFIGGNQKELDAIIVGESLDLLVPLLCTVAVLGITDGIGLAGEAGCFAAGQYASLVGQQVAGDKGITRGNGRR